MIQIKNLKKTNFSSSIDCIKHLYESSFDEKYKITFNQWKTYYTLIHGKFDTQKKIDYTNLSKLYAISLDEESLFNLLFAIESYYATLMRIVAARSISDIEQSDIDCILDGSFFVSKNIFNYTSDPIYDWYVSDSKLKSEVISSVIILSDNYLVKTGYQDLLKESYEEIFPAKIRNGMGEFHTPSWIIDFIIDELEKEDSDFKNKTIIDPTCGSGSFLINVLYRCGCNPSTLNNLIGIDLNPISVLTTKTNILLSMKKDGTPVTLQIYQGDVIDDLISKQSSDILNFASNIVVVNGFEIKYDKGWKYDDILNAYNKTENDAHCSYLESIFTNPNMSLYDRDCILSVLARSSLSGCDYVIGNPPWINWEYLPEEYKKSNIAFWKKYQLFSMVGMDKNFIKEDISELITYVSADRYLSIGGRLVFVLKESLFKSSKQAKEFRQFSLHNTKTDLCVEHVYDLTSLKPFDASNKTVILFLKKGSKTNYPVPYTVWTLRGRKNKHTDYKTDIISKELVAKPSVCGDIKSGWMTTSLESSKEKEKCLGSNEYKARIGVFTGGANSVFWIQVLDSKDHILSIRNITERAIKKVDSLETKIEDTYVNPMIRGRDVETWSFNSEQHIIFPHDEKSKMYPILIDDIAVEAPLTYNYLENFKVFLKERGGFAAWEKNLLDKNYHTLQRVGPYTFCKYKVSWRYISSTFKICVIDDDLFKTKNTFIPNEKIAYVGLDDKDEAYYLCGILSSTPYRETIESFMVSTQIGPGILDKLYIPTYNCEDESHRLVSRLCYEGHLSSSITPYLEQIDDIVKNNILQDR